MFVIPGVVIQLVPSSFRRKICTLALIRSICKRATLYKLYTRNWETPITADNSDFLIIVFLLLSVIDS